MSVSCCSDARSSRWGLFVSSLCESQVIAGIATIVPLLFLWIVNWNESAFF